MKERTRLKKGDLVFVSFLQEDKQGNERWIEASALVLSAKNTLQVAHIYIPKFKKHLKRVPYRFIRLPDNNKL